MSNEESVEKIYSEFDFEKMITNPPKEVQKYLDNEIEFINNHFVGGKTILEIGCGFGRLLESLSKNSKRVTGIDYSKNLLRIARERLKDKKNIELHHMNAKKLDFKDNSFDYVVCLDNTLGNMPGIEDQVFKEMVRVCKVGGEIILSTYSENSAPYQIANYKRIGLKNPHVIGNAVHTDDGFYSRRFTKEELLEFFSKEGLKAEVKRIAVACYVSFGKKE